MLIRDCVRLCEAEGHPDTAQSIRRETSLVLRDPGLLHDRLGRPTASRRKLKEAKVMREKAELERRSIMLGALLDWLK